MGVGATSTRSNMLSCPCRRRDQHDAHAMDVTYHTVTSLPGEAHDMEASAPWTPPRRPTTDICAIRRDACYASVARHQDDHLWHPLGILKEGLGQMEGGRSIVFIPSSPRPRVYTRGLTESTSVTFPGYHRSSSRVLGKQGLHNCTSNTHQYDQTSRT